MLFLESHFLKFEMYFILILSQFPIRLWCHCPGPVRYWQDGHVCHLHPAAAGDWSEGDPGAGVGSHQGTGPAGNDDIPHLNVNSVWGKWYDAIPSFGTDFYSGELLPLTDRLTITLTFLSCDSCAFFSVLPSSPQIQKVILALGDYMGAACHACIGGTNLRNEIQKLQAEAPHIVVGTPGRVFDMLSRGHLCEYWLLGVEWPGLGFCLEANTGSRVFADSKLIKMFVLDEADEMLSRGFKDQIYEIFQKLSTNIQVSVLARGAVRPLGLGLGTLTEVCYECVIQIVCFIHWC